MASIEKSQNMGKKIYKIFFAIEKKSELNSVDCKKIGHRKNETVRRNQVIQ